MTNSPHCDFSFYYLLLVCGAIAVQKTGAADQALCVMAPDSLAGQYEQDLSQLFIIIGRNFDDFGFSFCSEIN